jgi:hypothetical protein
LIFGIFLSGSIEWQTASSLIEPHVFFGENGCPLEGRAVHNLTSTTVTELGIQWPFASQRVWYFAALAVGAPLDLAKFIDGPLRIRRAVAGVFVFERVLGRVLERRRGRITPGIKAARLISHNTAIIAIRVDKTERKMRTGQSDFYEGVLCHHAYLELVKRTLALDSGFALWHFPDDIFDCKHDFTYFHFPELYSFHQSFFMQPGSPSFFWKLTDLDIDDVI